MDCFNSGVNRSVLDLSEKGTSVALSMNFSKAETGSLRQTPLGPCHILLAHSYFSCSCGGKYCLHQGSPCTDSGLRSKLPLSSPWHCTRLRAPCAHVHAQLEKKKKCGEIFTLAEALNQWSSGIKEYIL